MKGPKDRFQTDEAEGVVGQKGGGGESKGHGSGRGIAETLDGKEPDLTGDDVDHTRRAVTCVHRHQAQGPSGDVENSDWRYSLMNWGHGPLK